MRRHIRVGRVDRSETHLRALALRGIASLHPSYEPAVIASAAKQSIITTLSGKMDGFALLAMTRMGRGMLHTPQMRDVTLPRSLAKSSTGNATPGLAEATHAHVKGHSEGPN